MTFLSGFLAGVVSVIVLILGACIAAVMLSWARDDSLISVGDDRIDARRYGPFGAGSEPELDNNGRAPQ